jgi:uncharacterized membrane protein YhhN
MPRLTPLRASVPFLLVSFVELAARVLDLDGLSAIAKPLLMPFLALVVALAGPREGSAPQRFLLAALAFSWVGDVVLMNDGLAFFAVGLGAFLLAHVFYIALFTRGFEGRVSPFAVGYLPWYGALVALLAPHVGVLLVPVLVYGAVLSVMAALSTRGGRILAAGGALFVASDSILALERFSPDFELPMASFLVMLTYLAAQWLIVLGATVRLRARADFTGMGSGR